MASSYGEWWIEIVVAVVGLMCAGFVAGESAAFVRVRRMRQRDGGLPAPRTKDEYLLLFPRACPRCLSRRGRRVKGWHVDEYGQPEFANIWQCADCSYLEGGKRLSPMPDAEITRQSVRASQRWFISADEAERVERPALDPET